MPGLTTTSAFPNGAGLLGPLQLGRTRTNHCVTLGRCLTPAMMGLLSTPSKAWIEAAEVARMDDDCPVFDCL